MNPQLGRSQPSISFNVANDNDFPFQWPPTSSTIAYNCLSVLVAYYLLVYFDVLPFTITQALWNTIVYLAPARIVFALDKTDTGPDTADSRAGAVNARSHQAKSEAMERVLGLDSASFFATFPRARSLSGLGNVLLGSKENPPGLGNWDNSCYQNSIIQGLASLRSLDVFLKNNIEELREKGELSTHVALTDIMAKLNDPANSGHKLWTPSDLKSMSSWQQQDAQEYFSKVVEKLDREVLEASKGRTTNMGLKSIESREDALRAASKPLRLEGNKLEADSGIPQQVPESNSSARNPLEGLLAQRVGCMECGWAEGLSMIPFNCLTLPLGRSWEYDVRDCLDDYTNLEPIEGVECAKCTLLRTKDQLEKLLTQVKSDMQAEENPNPELSEALKHSAETRLKTVQEALDEESFSEDTLSKKCHIPTRNRVSSTKSRQAVIARSPESLVIHVNRSLFNEMTGAQTKNYADLRFPKVLNLDEWCLGAKSTSHENGSSESWGIDPSESMLPSPGAIVEPLNKQYELQAVITHYGRHENGHYICYRKYPTELFPAILSDDDDDDNDENKEPLERWFRLSDDDVCVVSESNVLSQGGVFMLFYEAVEPSPSAPIDTPQPAEIADSVHTSTDSIEESERLVDTADTSVDDDQESMTSKSDAYAFGSRPMSISSCSMVTDEEECASLDSETSEPHTPSHQDQKYPHAQLPNSVTPIMRTATSAGKGQEPHDNVLSTSPSMVKAL